MKLKSIAKMFIISLSLTLALLAPTPQPAQGDNFDLPGGACLFPGETRDISQLIAAIGAANANGTADTITLAKDCVYQISGTPDNYIDGPNTLPSIISPITIEGNGATIGSAGFSRIFHIGSSGDLTLKNLTAKGGNVWAGGGGAGRTDGGGGGFGGAIYNRGGLTLINTLLSNNYAVGGNGGTDGGPVGSAGGGVQFDNSGTGCGNGGGGGGGSAGSGTPNNNCDVMVDNYGGDGGPGPAGTGTNGSNGIAGVNTVTPVNACNHSGGSGGVGYNGGGGGGGGGLC